MEFSCRLYYNTGFDPVNVPASKSVLETAAGGRYADFGPLDIHQSDFQPVIKIRCPHGEDDVIGADYLALKTTIAATETMSAHNKYTYYSIVSYEMTSPDVAVLSVVMDSFLTAGGINGVTFIDGVTERHHVADDLFGEYCEDDPMLVPSEPLMLVHYGSWTDAEQGEFDKYYCGCSGDTGIFFNYEDPDYWWRGDVNLVQSTVNLGLLGFVETDEDDIQRIMAVEPKSIFSKNKSTLTKYLADTVQVLINPQTVLPDDVDVQTEYPEVPLARGHIDYMFEGFVDVNTCTAVHVSKQIGGTSPSGVRSGVSTQGRAVEPDLVALNVTSDLWHAPLDNWKRWYKAPLSAFQKMEISGYSLYWLGCSFFDSAHPTASILESLKAVRALGLESAIKRSYSVPRALCQFNWELAQGDETTKYNTDAPSGRSALGGVFVALTTNGVSYDATGSAALTGFDVGGEASGEADITGSGRSSRCYNFRYESGSPRHNQRVYYGKYNKYVLIVPSTGAKIEANPEDLIPAPFDAAGTIPNRPPVMNNFSISGQTDLSENVKAPYICVISDPRPEGRPYFNFIMRRRSNFGLVNVYDGAIAGERWREYPLTLSGYSGWYQRDIAYEINKANRDVESSAEYQYMRARAGGVDSLLGSADPSGSTMIGARNPVSIDTTTPAARDWGLSSSRESGGVSAGAHMALGLAESAMSLGMENIKYNMGAGYAYDWMPKERARVSRIEEMQYNLSKAYTEPEVKFLPTPTLRDAVGNGVFYARFRPTDNDLSKFDKILDRFGYQDVRPVEDSFMSNRTKWNYLRVKGAVVRNKETNDTKYATIDGEARYRSSKTLLEDVSSMFANGIRIWHVKPDLNQLNPRRNT